MIRMLGSMIKRQCLAFVNFWNIPPLGANESEESRRLRFGPYL